MNILLKLLLVVSVSCFAQSEVNINDKFVFKVSQEVYSVTELKGYFVSMRQFHCVYNDSLVWKVFSGMFLSKNEPYLSYEKGKNFSDNQKKYFESLLKFGKLLVYTESQNIKSIDEISRYLIFKAKKTKCAQDIFQTEHKLHKYYLEILKMEKFLRKRFLPAENFESVAQRDMLKAVSSARNLIDSIDKQVSEEVYW
ncbi:MAG: hypothetical protein QF441_04750 [Bacteriovoracaceae bacterium]|jgi:hypothetical protein|nr:hypothetical protein [Bacteriovoracaceae bacterium]